jgi:hypothetical protein
MIYDFVGHKRECHFRLNYLNKERMKRANTNIKKIYEIYIISLESVDVERQQH